MADVIIFGILDTAELAHFYLENDSDHNVAAFAVNREFIKEDEFKGLPLVAFEEVERHFPPSGYSFFVPMTARNMNRNREKIYLEVKSKGYSLITYISSKATVFHPDLIGENCFILEDNTIQPFTSIGNNVVLWSGNHIGHHGKIDDHVFFTSQVVLSGHCHVHSHCFFGVNATVKDYLTVASGTLLGMASSLTKNSEEWGIYVGNPAKRIPGKLSYEAY